MTTGSDGNISIMLGNGNGTFSAPFDYAAGAYPNSVAIGDFNADGKPDVAVSGPNGIYVLLGNGDGAFQSAVTYGAGGNYASLVSSDFNGDSKQDLAALSSYAGSYAVVVFFGNGNGTFQSPVNVATGTYYNFLAVADMNLDRIPDLIASNGNFSAPISVLLATGTEPSNLLRIVSDCRTVPHGLRHRRFQ